MKPDEGHNLTEKELAKLERRIASVYGEAARELQETVGKAGCRNERTHRHHRKRKGMDGA